jgi:hypothetical protein
MVVCNGPLFNLRRLKPLTPTRSFRAIATRTLGAFMQAEPDQKSVHDLVDLHRQGMLKANPEYQRGIVWSPTQKKKLIDSVLRGYPIPLIYLHHIKKIVAGMQRDDLEIIDGQQRINSLFEFSEGAFKLFDPIVDDRTAKFPKFIKEQPCPWAGKDYEALSPELKEAFRSKPLAVALIQTDSPNEVRDLFVRLQSGLPLNSQETRDAWPGDFTDFVLKLGGKPELARYPGHDFFTKTMRMRPRTDRGKTRQLAAQIAMLFLSRRWNGEGNLPDINSKSLDDFYYSNLGFNSQSAEASRLTAILSKIENLLAGGKHSKLHGHDAIHLILLVDALWDDYTRSWEDKLPAALDGFLSEFAKSKENYSNDFWIKYGQWTRVSSDRGAFIALRHKFYVEKMSQFMGDLQLKDPTRLFGEIDRTILYYQQEKKCAVCEATMAWSAVEVHHVAEHSKGGKTRLQNGAAVHKACHPKGEAQTNAFAEKFLAMSSSK